MKKLATSVFVLLLTAAVAFSASAQTIRRVSLTATGTNIYATFALAQTAATAGDIIQMEPGTYGFDINLTKNLTVVGPGYFLDRYTAPALQANTTPATVNNVYFNAGSSGASVAGITMSGCFVSTSTVTLQRCNVTGTVYVNYNNVPVNNVNIRQNYLNSLQNYYSGATNLLITNNIITGSVSFDNSTSGEYRNNVNSYLYGQVTLNNFNVTNNYFYYYQPLALTNCTVTYNAFYYSAAPSTNGNINNVSLASAFVLGTGAQYDGFFVLKAGTNPLRGTGENGVDMGAYAGNAPYKAGGVPAIPAIYQLNNSVNGNTLNVNMSTRSNN
jgi:hypothetical protein